MIVGDLEEVEEWNEYGELRDNVEPGPRAAPSAPATPSKAPTGPSSDTLSIGPAPNPVTPSKPSPLKPSAETPTRPAPSSTDSPLTTAMRQAGFEAAKIAGDAKSKARAEALQASKAQADTQNSETLQKLDNSGPTGMPPPSGTTEAGEAIKPETGNTSAEGKADGVPVAEEGKEEGEEEGQNPNVQGTGAIGGDKSDSKDKETKIPSSKQAEESANPAMLADQSEEVLEGQGQAEHSPEDIPSSKEVEEAANASIMHDKSHIVLVGSREADRTPPSEPVEETTQSSSQEEKGGSNLKQATSISDADQILPGEKTQEQHAASGEEAGISVAD